MAAATAPFLVVGLWYAFTGHLLLGGDQSLIALDALDARHLDQFVGPYSRMGWAHPGPAWAYLLAPLFWLFGSGGAALIGASMLIEALFAALVVVAAGTGRAWQRPLMACVVLLYVLRMPSVDFVAVWNPFVLLLPTILALLLAARAAAGSVAAFATSLAVLSFLLQTHIGTAPFVALVGLVTVVVLGWRLVRHPDLRPDRRSWKRISIPLAGTVLMWVPPVWQQLTARPHEGNLRMIAGYFIHGGGGQEITHTWREAVSSVGQMLGAPVYGWPATPAVINTAILTPAVLAAVAVQLAGGIAVAVVARRVADRQVFWLAVMTAVATVAALGAAKTVTGPLENYLLLWVSVLPAVLLFAGSSLVLSLGIESWRAAPQRLGTAVAAVLTACGVAGTVVVGLSLNRSADTFRAAPGSGRPAELSPGAHQAAQLALAALPAPRHGAPPVLLDITDVSTWITATEVAFELEDAGQRISVTRKWEYGFGWDRLSTGNERWRLSLVPLPPGRTPPSGALGTVATINGPEAVVLERTGR